MRSLAKALFYSAAMAFFLAGISVFPAAAQVGCIFTPTGQPICVGEWQVRCPICPTPGLPRPSGDGSKFAQLEAVNQARQTLTDTYNQYQQLQQNIKNTWGDQNDFANLSSDEMLLMYTSTLQNLEDFQIDPDIRQVGTLEEIGQDILDHFYAQTPNPSISEQLRIRNKRQRAYERAILVEYALAQNTKFLTEDTPGGQRSPSTIMLERLEQQIRQAESTKEISSTLNARGAILRVNYAITVRVAAMKAVRDQRRALAELITAPVAQPTSLQNVNGRQQSTPLQIVPNSGGPPPEVLQLTRLNSNISSIDPATSVLNGGGGVRAGVGMGGGGSMGGGRIGGGVGGPVGGGGDGIPRNIFLGIGGSVGGGNVGGGNNQRPDDLGVIPAAYDRLRQPGQLQIGEEVVNSPTHRAEMLERLHNDLVMMARHQEQLQYLQDTLSCHDFSRAQVDRFANQIIPQLELIAGGRNLGGGAARPTSRGPYSDPGNAFLDLAGRLPQLAQQADGTYAEIPGSALIGRLLQLDATTYYDLSDKNRAATIAGCQAAGIMMRGNQAPALSRRGSTLSNALIHPTTCRPNSVSCFNPDGLPESRPQYCLTDQVRQSLAPVVMPGPRSCNATYIMPGDTCRIVYPYGGNRFAASPGGDLGQWLTAYKVERMWAHLRFGTPIMVRTDNQQATLPGGYGAEHALRDLRQWMREIADGYNERIKALNDADARMTGRYIRQWNGREWLLSDPASANTVRIGDTHIAGPDGSEFGDPSRSFYYRIDITTPEGVAAAEAYIQAQVQILRNELAIKRQAMEGFNLDRVHMDPNRAREAGQTVPREVLISWSTFNGLADQRVERARQQLDALDAFADRAADRQYNSCNIYREARPITLPPFDSNGNPTPAYEHGSDATINSFIECTPLIQREKMCLGLWDAASVNALTRVHVTPGQIEQ
ncbi:MAG: hypothetical protein AB7G80_06360 [Dongiaceae bacterium]